MFNLKPYLGYIIAVGLLLTVAAWNIDRARQFQKGKAAASVEISNRLKDGYIEQVKSVRQAEQKQEAAFRQKQEELEKENENAKQTVNAMRTELDRLRRYATHQSSRRNLPTNPAAPSTPDDKDDSAGWILFSRCAEKYAGLAETADGQAADLREWQAYGKAVSDNK